jgi:hypothetical protein
VSTNVVFCWLGQLSVGDDSSSSGDTSSSSSQSDLSPQHQPVSSASSLPAITSPNPSLYQQRRSFHLRMIQKAVSRSELTQYELVHVLGFLSVPQRPTPGPSTPSRTRNRARGIYLIIISIGISTRISMSSSSTCSSSSCSSSRITVRAQNFLTLKKLGKWCFSKEKYGNFIFLLFYSLW